MQVALLAEGVDRNRLPAEHPKRAEQVALLAEGVDRNPIWALWPVRAGGVALLAEGVDRNSLLSIIVQAENGRPPRGGRG